MLRTISANAPLRGHPCVKPSFWGKLVYVFSGVLCQQLLGD